MKKILILLAALLSLAATATIAVRYVQAPDTGGTWVCRDGAWRSEGTPNTPPPDGSCDKVPDFVKDFSGCVAAGNPVMETYPRQCRTADGVNYVETIPSEESEGLISVLEPMPDAVVSSPLAVRGQARGPWFFEASFPVEVRDGAGALLGQGVAQAQGEWMTEEFVPFLGTIEFSEPVTAAGTVVFKKDNPSGLPEHDRAVAVPVRFR